MDCVSVFGTRTHTRVHTHTHTVRSRVKASGLISISLITEAWGEEDTQCRWGGGGRGRVFRKLQSRRQLRVNSAAMEIRVPSSRRKTNSQYGATHSPINTRETGSLYRFLRLQLLSIPISISASRRWRKTKESRVVRRTAMDDGNRAEGTRSERKSVEKKPISMEIVNQPSGHLCN